MDYNSLKKNNPELYKLLVAEQRRQEETINLTASENYVSPAVLEALGTVFTNKYAEGGVQRRYYFGIHIVDEMESRAKELALKVFKLDSAKWGVNVQPYSGSPANFAVYFALTSPGDTILAMKLAHGGHLTHGSPVNMTGKLWNFVHYGVGEDGRLDYREIGRLAKKCKPRLIVCGTTAYSRTIDFKKFASIAKKYGALLVADISHVAGLVAGGAHPSPFPYADVVTTTTHKTLRGPRGAIIISRKQKIESRNKKPMLHDSRFMIHELVDRAVFPGLQGGPHENQIFAMAVAFQEVLRPKFRAYARQVVKNAQTLAKELLKAGFQIVSGGTDNHLMMVDVTPFGWTGQTAGRQLEEAGIVLNKNMLPFDTRTPMDPSGIRIGTAPMTTRGMKEKEMQLIAKLIVETLIEKKPTARVKKKVITLAKKFPTP